MMQDITEQQDVAREISDAISRPTGEEFDEVDTFPTLFLLPFCVTILKLKILDCVWYFMSRLLIHFLLYKNAPDKVLLTLCVWLGRSAGGAGRAGTGRAGGEHEENGRTSQRAQLQSAFSTARSARK